IIADSGHGALDLAARLGKNLAIFHGQQARERLDFTFEIGGPFQENGLTMARILRPFEALKSRARRRYRCFGLFESSCGEGPQTSTAGRIERVRRRAATGNPCAIDEMHRIMEMSHVNSSVDELPGDRTSPG